MHSTSSLHRAGSPVESARIAFDAVHTEGFTTIDGTRMYCIPSFDQMNPFLMSIVSDSDLWMFVSSTGGLTAGRCSPEHGLFLYETDDRLHHLQGTTGPLTLIRVLKSDHATVLWEPFAPVLPAGVVQRNLYKSLLGNRVMFEETHHELGLTFQYTWSNCDEFGFVRTARLINRSSSEPARVELLDGLLNIMPAGVPMAIQQGSSCLADAYKFCEVDARARLAIYSLSSLPSDRAEPAECLRANSVWTCGLDKATIALSDRAVREFRLGNPIRGESHLRGQRGNFLLCTSAQIPPRDSISWHIVGDANRTQKQIGDLTRWLASDAEVETTLRSQRTASSNALRGIVASADAIQSSADDLISSHHSVNVLFNVMRGGAMHHNGTISRTDFGAFVAARNVSVAELHEPLLRALPERMTRAELFAATSAADDANLTRLAYEYLPITFARRHGDPSRPWNQFAIHVKNDDGTPVLNYQGNWRDIFQNWEALCISFPEYIESVIAKFVNASTIDGFNPYRITRDGIDWEIPESHNPWSNIGYWGDHQLVYLLRLLELSRRYHPGILENLLHSAVFTYADVPYRIRPYTELLKNCRSTIDFDHAREAQIRDRAKSLGADGRLLTNHADQVHHATLAEKLLVPVLSKLGSLVVDGGIWMNTQRPEWNDANNALAGFGLSVVTLCYLRRTTAFLIDLLESANQPRFTLAFEVAEWISQTSVALHRHASLNDGQPISDVDRKLALDALGEAFARYRATVYASGFSSPKHVETTQILSMLRAALCLVDRSILANRREDRLFHGYNLLKLSFDRDEAGIERLSKMLEGQVAALSSGVLDGAQSLEVINALFDSDIFRADQQSFMLYPDRSLPGFLEKNVFSAVDLDDVPLLRGEIDKKRRRIVVQDGPGSYRFAPEMRNEGDLRRELALLTGVSDGDRHAVLNLYEKVFHHHAFTGRSGSMFGYEGLGCIYWHMVAKLLVAVQEIYLTARARGESLQTLDQLAIAYYRVRSGLGFNKSALEYGAFPADPYSHTPGHSGARQPGMTGQVKEEIITRFGELGVVVAEGRLQFSPTLLRRAEFHSQPSRFEFVDLTGLNRTIELPADSLAFTYCQVPVIYKLDGSAPQIWVVRRENHHEIVPGTTLDTAVTQSILTRDGSISRLEVTIDPRALL